MQTMHPCIMLGSYVLDRDRLPEDEFRIRMDDVYRSMDERGLAALIVYGDAREHFALAYLSNFIPRMRWGMALFTRAGPPRLLCSMSSRDMPAMRTMTWIESVFSGWEWKWFDEWVATLRSPAMIGTIGFDLMAPALHRSVEKSLGGGFELNDAADILDRRSRKKRPREIALLKSAAAITQSAIAVFANSWRSTHDPERAALEAERYARMQAAQDVRTMVSFDEGATIEPYRGNFDTKTSLLCGYIAVKFSGYWAGGFVSVDAPRDLSRRAEAALDRLVATMRPGLSARSLRESVSSGTDLQFHPYLSDSVGSAVGLSLHEAPELSAGLDTVIETDQVYALQTGFVGGEAGAFASAMVHVRRGGVEVMLRSVPS